LNKICDLHTHSVYSDGTYTPAEIIDEAIRNGLSAVALTDHNTVDGLPDFIAAARGKDIKVVPGAEFSVDHNGIELHILGLFITPEHFDKVAKLMSDVNRKKEESNIVLIESLSRAGYPLNYEEIKAKTPNGMINRSQIADALIEKGYFSSKNECFNSILSPQAGHYKEPKRLTALEIISFIKSINALPVLAHPFLDENEKEKILDFLPQAKKQGLVGIECYYSTYSEKDTEELIQVAERLGLVCSGGSDFHGKAKAGIELGSGYGNLKIPYECYTKLKALL
jgi:predicted metal-dependent phosphoesterase TrpH